MKQEELQAQGQVQPQLQAQGQVQGQEQSQKQEHGPAAERPCKADVSFPNSKDCKLSVRVCALAFKYP